MKPLPSSFTFSRSHVIISPAFCSSAKLFPPPPLLSHLRLPFSPSLRYILIVPIVPQLICDREGEIDSETWECLMWGLQLAGEQRNVSVEKLNECFHSLWHSSTVLAFKPRLLFQFVVNNFSLCAIIQQWCIQFTSSRSVMLFYGHRCSSKGVYYSSGLILVLSGTS